MKVSLICAPTETRYYTDIEIECWRNLHILRYQLQFKNFLSIDEFLQLENIWIQNNGLLSIASTLINAGHEVTYQYPESYKDINFDELLSSKVIGISSLTSNYQNAKKLARQIKSNSSDIHILIGGHHAPYLYEQILGEPDCPFDYIISGFAEDRVLKLINKIEKREDTIIPGVAFRAKSGRIFYIEDRSIVDLDRIPISAYDLIKQELLGARVFTSYGCPFSCVFCNLGKEVPQSKSSIGRLEMELRYLKEKKNPKFIYIGDPTFGTDLRRLSEISKLMNELKLYWQFQTRVTVVNDRMLDILRGDSFFCGIELGIESFNNELLNRTRKGITVEKSRQTIDKINEAGINLLTYWMFGLPGTNKDITSREFLDMSSLINQNILVHLNLMVPYPGTEYFFNPARYGIKLESLDWNQYYSGGDIVHSLTDPSLSRSEILHFYSQGLTLLASTTRKRIELDIFEKFKEFQGITVYRGLY